MMGISGTGGISLDFKNLYFVRGSSQWGAIFNGANAEGVNPAIIRWENVRYVTIVNSALVLGALIPQPYGRVNNFANAIYGRANTSESFSLGATGGGIYLGSSGVKTYNLASLSHSLLASPHWIADFKVGIDILNGPGASTITPVVLAQKITALTSGDIGLLLASEANFPVNGAAIFRLFQNREDRIYLALNNGTPGFSPTEDAIIEITGYSGDLAAFRVA
jgi:serralysin